MLAHRQPVILDRRAGGVAVTAFPQAVIGGRRQPVNLLERGSRLTGAVQRAGVERVDLRDFGVQPFGQVSGLVQLV